MMHLCVKAVYIRMLHMYTDVTESCMVVVI